MTYGDLQTAVYSLNTGNIPDGVAFLAKLISGKITRRRMPSRVKLASVNTGGSLVLNLRTLVPDFLEFKFDPNNENRVIYSLDSSNRPYFYRLVSPASFAEYTSGGYAKIEGSTLTLKVDEGATTPTTIYFPYFSFYAWADGTTDAEKETPSSNDDYCILPSVFDDVLIDGILLYISRREKESKEYEKNVIEWEKRVNEMIFYS